MIGACIIVLLVLLGFKIVNQTFLKFIALREQELGCIDILLILLSMLSNKFIVTVGIGLTALYFAIANYLRKHGDSVAATWGIEDGGKIILLVNKKDKPLIINSIYFRIHKKYYLELEDKNKKGMKFSSDFEVVKPYETLVKNIKNNELVDDLFFDSGSDIEIILLTIDGLVACERLSIEPLPIKALRYEKKIKILDPYKN